MQESKLSEVDLSCITQLTGWRDAGFAWSLAVNRSGGIICCWNLSSFCETSRVCQPQFVAITGSWIARDGLEGIICIYAPNDLSERVDSFESLGHFVTQWNCHDYIILGDFNSVLLSGERWGRNGFNDASAELVDFVDLLGL